MSASKPQRRRTSSLAKWSHTLLLPLSDIVLWLGLYFGISQLTGGYNAISPSTYLLPIVVTVVSLATIGGYSSRNDFLSLRYASEHLIALIFALMLSALVVYSLLSFGAGVAPSRAILAFTFAAFAPVSLITRRMTRSHGAGATAARKFLVIADEKIGPIFHRDYERSEQAQQLRYLAASKELRGQQVAGPESPSFVVEIAHLLPYLDRESIVDYEAVVIAADLSSFREDVLRKLGQINFEELPVYTTETFYETYWKRLPLEVVSPAWPLESEFTLVQHSVYNSVKRLLDIVVALLCLIVASPIMLLTALAVLILDGRPILYRQPRTGLYQRVFTLFKFRSMKVGSDKGDGYTREGDVRVTRLGNFLRKSRLDELPQLLNVLRGDMSMIGPRAEWTRLVADYEQQIPNYHFRHLVRPGITGWAQVNYPYGANLEDTLQKLSYDLYYIRNFSMQLDAEVLLKTVYVMLFGKGR